MKLSDKITYHLSGIILYGALALFLGFIGYTVYVIRFQPCSANGYQQTILSEVDNTIISELTKYELEREKLFTNLLKQKLTEKHDFDLSLDDFIEQQKLFSNTLLYWSKNMNANDSKTTIEALPKQVDRFYLEKINKTKPNFVIPAYEPLANDYYRTLIDFLKEDRFYRQAMLNNIEGDYHSSLFDGKSDLFSKQYFAKLFQITRSTDIKEFINVSDKNSIYQKLFASNELICEAKISYPNDNNLLVLFTPNADSHGNLKSLQVDYNLVIHSISQNKQPIDIEDFGREFITSFQNHKFNN